ncbi:response regulator [Paenibacillus harenae]|uniref:Two-component system response regulator YesN n=1 Tax=Paenibacillus harenae TaxID=306543 RepID=A0ABT9TZL4_PAEHA|nr:response regulator [Paenibacillus harenae]MDQ0112148.1 two-component system response regulator YesN [Paenibacillus harenae]
MGTIRTLIVDDEPRIRRGIERHVQSLGEGWEVVATAGDGREALQLLQGHNGNVDLLITDVKMPEMDGLTLIKEAKKLYAIYPLLISGFDDFIYLQTALREGALDYILKPLDREQFRNRMLELRDVIAQDRHRRLTRSEMERDTEKLSRARQIQTLSYITSTDINITNLGCWVDEFPRGKYMLQLVRLDTLPVKTRAYTAKDWKAYFYALENILSEVVDSELSHSGRTGWCFFGGESDFWVLMHGAQDDEQFEDIGYRLAEKVRTSIRSYTPFTVSIAYGHTIEELYLLPEAKRQSLARMNYRYVRGGNRIFHAAERLEEGDSDLLGKEAAILSQMLKRAVDQANEADALKVCKRFFELIEQMESPSRIQSAALNAVILIHSAQLENTRGLSDGISIMDEIQKVKRAASIQELRSCILRLAEYVIHDIIKSRQSSNVKLIEQAKRWIADHRAEDVTIKKIADHVYMNPTYFSEYFKMQTGETVLDYLTRLRIELAKELLRDTRLKLHDICGKVGYQDVKYFSKLFKLKLGMTPSQYRESTNSDPKGAGKDDDEQ